MLITDQRLHNQRITRPGGSGPAKMVAWLGAVQAQEYGPAKWSLALRLPPGATDAVVERAVNQGRILRTHVLRPTWHFVTPADIRWMLELTAPLVHRRMSSYDRRLGLDAGVMTRATGVIERTLGEGRCLTRVELGVHLARAGLPGTSMHLAHIAMYAELEGVICSGPSRGKQFTYALLADRAPRAQRLSREEALAELTLRFFRSHGPATIRVRRVPGGVPGPACGATLPVLDPELPPRRWCACDRGAGGRHVENHSGCHGVGSGGGDVEAAHRW